MLHSHQKIFSVEGFKTEFLSKISQKSQVFFLSKFDFQKLFKYRVISNDFKPFIYPSLGLSRITNIRSF